MEGGKERERERGRKRERKIEKKGGGLPVRFRTDAVTAVLFPSLCVFGCMCACMCEYVCV